MERIWTYLYRHRRGPYAACAAQEVDAANPLLGLAIGFSLSAALWSFTLILLAMAFMVYLAPGRRREVFVVLGGASVIGLAVYTFFTLVTGGHWIPIHSVLQPRLSRELFHTLNFTFADGFLKPEQLSLCGSLHCSADDLWKLAAGTLFWEHRTIADRFYCGAAVRAGARGVSLERNFRVKFCVLIYWRNCG